MKFFTSALVVSLLALTASMVFAQERYGDAVVEQGDLTVVRQGNNLKFAQGGQPVPVVVGDVLRAGENSRVVLKTREKSTIAMGANAVFQVKPFQYQEKQGFARMLFGRFRSVVQGLTGAETVNAKTATAVIGVKGTENFASIRPRGDTMLVGIEKVTSIQSGARGPGRRASGYGDPLASSGEGGFVQARDDGASPDFILIPTTGEPLQVQRVQDGGETPIGEGFTGLTLGDNPPVSGPTPDEVLEALQDLNSPPPGDPGAGQFPGQQGLVRTGLASQDDLDEGESEEVEGGGPAEGAAGGEAQSPNVETPNLDDPAKNLFRGDVNIQFQQ